MDSTDLELIGREIPGTAPELQLRETRIEDLPDTVLTAGSWHTDAGTFFLEAAGSPVTGGVCFLAVSECEGGRQLFTAEEIGEIFAFRRQYPETLTGIQKFLRKTGNGEASRE